MCPHCHKPIDWADVIDALRKRDQVGPDERSRLIAWLTHWRVEQSLPPANLRTRSTEQLRKLRAEATRGTGYRVGRKWAKHG